MNSQETKSPRPSLGDAGGATVARVASIQLMMQSLCSFGMSAKAKADGPNLKQSERIFRRVVSDTAFTALGFWIPGSRPSMTRESSITLLGIRDNPRIKSGAARTSVIHGSIYSERGVR
jgi:hypothetical protein